MNTSKFVYSSEWCGETTPMTDDSGYNTFTPDVSLSSITYLSSDILVDTSIDVLNKNKLIRQDAVEMMEDSQMTDNLFGNQSFNTPFHSTIFESSIRKSERHYRSDGKKSFYNGINRDSKIIKKHTTQNIYRPKLGTPEKNKLLYPEIKPVSPPRISKTPEKLIKKHDFFKILPEEVILCILKFLSGKDIRIMYSLSSQWRNIILKNKSLNDRRIEFISYIKTEMENRSLDCDFNKNKVQIGKIRQTTLADVTNMFTNNRDNKKESSLSPQSRRHKIYRDAASIGETRHCIKCYDPAILKERWATCTKCKYVFCSRCHYSSEILCKRKGCESRTGSSSPEMSPVSENKHITEKVHVKKIKRRGIRRLMF